MGPLDEARRGVQAEVAQGDESSILERPRPRGADPGEVLDRRARVELRGPPGGGSVGGGVLERSGGDYSILMKTTAALYVAAATMTWLLLRPIEAASEEEPAGGEVEATSPT